LHLVDEFDVEASEFVLGFEAFEVVDAGFEE
jgi:hypothetical protein